ncbi:MAG: hypothetical protein IJ711_02670 [Lachnospiraceae bacterium]|nr:hypothetical protein [Lachnospiraceae bacterium]
MTLFISESEQDAVQIRRCDIKTGWRYIGFALFCLVFGFIYEQFSHEVYSTAMLYAFVFPLVAGLAWLAAGLHSSLPQLHPVSADCYHMGVVTCTVGSLFQGALEIYGTTSRFTSLYWYVGIALLLAALGAAVLLRRRDTQ